MPLISQLFSRRRRYDDLSVSIQEHVAERTEELVDEGMPRAEAEQVARREFGNVGLMEQRSREAWQWPTTESILADIRFALRQLMRSPGTSILTVVTLALGLGANTAVFTLTWNIVLASLPVPNPGQLVEYEMRNGESVIGLSGPQYSLLRQRQKTCTDLLAWASDKMPVRQGKETEQTHVQFLSPNAFQVLEIAPALGNFFSEGRDGREGSKGIPAVLSYDAWQNRFHGDPAAIGQSLSVDDHAVTIVGVMPQAFEGLTANFHPELYLPLSFSGLVYGQNFLTSPGFFGHFVLGRLKPGASIAGARAELQAISPTLRKDADLTGRYLNQFFKSYQLTIREGRSGVSWVKSVYERPLFVLEMLVLFVLALCCVNTAMVMLARVSGRRHEFAVRSALGAGRVRLIRQVLAETTLLTLPGFLLGIGLGWLAAHLLVDMLGDRGTPSAMDLKPNAIILAVSICAAAAVTIGGGLWPALRAGWSEPVEDLKETGPTSTSRRLGGWAISLQVAVSLSLVSAAVLLGNTLSGLLTEHSGFQPRGAVLASLPIRSLKLKPEQEIDLRSRLLNAVLAQPGVEAAGYISLRPLSGSFGTSRMFSIDRDHVVRSYPNLFYVGGTSGYLAAAGTRMLAGESEAALAGGPPACVLSESMARFFFPHQSAVGELVYGSSWPQPDGINLDLKNACRVTGVAEDVRFVSLRQPAPPMLYSIERLDAADKHPTSFEELLVRGSSTSLAAGAVRQAATQVMPTAASPTVQTLGTMIDQDLSRERMLVSLSGAFAVLALLLTNLGLYGLLMRSVTMRKREIAIRMALGATRKQVVDAVVRRTLFELALGLFAGAILTLLVTKAARLLLEIPSSLNSVYALLAGGAVLLFIALLAVFIPAQRAAAIDPMNALRAE